ncbi:retinol dehydrogenase 13-like [Anneissia japonica]|uniref:retinol dehydrogenase 13-like n=1 Tax=Anneissia japonica TaxID=1529436 RepID=UPI0014258832|nr:retinol dehydrogenase 13-like [Anneissia japonica]
MSFFKRLINPNMVFPLSFVGTVVGGSLIAKDYFGGRECRCKNTIEGKTVIITGANCGIGKETALDLAKRGGRIILACRDEAKAQKACREIIAESDNQNVSVKLLDLASLKSIRKFAQEINEEEKQVQILINNAGVMRCPYKKTEDGYEYQFAVNHLGHFLLTNLLLDKLKQSKPGRIITVSSIAHERGEIEFDDLNSEKNYDKAYAYSDSKLANVLFTHELSRRLQGTGVTANCLHPGIVKTQIGRHTAMQNSQFSMSILGPIFWMFVKTPVQGAQTTIECAVNEKLETVSGKYFKDCKITECDPKGRDDEVAIRLWNVSEQMVGLVSDVNLNNKETTSS